MIVIKNEHPTGWMAFVRAFKEANPGAIIDYKVLMQMYIRGRAPSSSGGHNEQ